MTDRTPARSRRLVGTAIALAVVALSGTAVAATPAEATPSRGQRLPRIVVLRDTTTGQVTDAVRSARTAALSTLAARVGATPTSMTSTALASFTAPLDADQAARLAADPAVLTVQPVQAHRTTAVGTPGFLGVDGTGPGTWSSVGGPVNAGRGVVVAMIDSGIWPENPAFTRSVEPLLTAPTTRVGAAYRTSATGTAVRRADGGTFHGDCGGALTGRAVESWSPALCNAAIVSARAFAPGAADGWVKPSATDPKGREFASPRDTVGHGTHTASTAAGRSFSATYTDPRGTRRAVTSTGIAPGAQLAVYKACWTTRSDGDADGLWDNYCYDDTLIAAIDQAVKDGVDIVNLSISGTADDARDPLELAMLGATRAGVLVVAAAGNDGDLGPGSVNHPVPWALTVGASTWQNATPATAAVAWYSGRGAARTFAGGVLKPDLVAPGTDIVASVPPAPGHPATEASLGVMTGTSMATPHVSGVAAMLLAQHPAWSPMMVRSAITASARPLLHASAFEDGSGLLDPAAAARADLLLDAAPVDYSGVLAWVTAATGSRLPVDLNQPNVVLPDVANRHVARRTVVAQRPGTWSVRASLPGYAVSVTPVRGFARRAGDRFVVTVTVRRTTAARGVYAEGAITLTGTQGTERLPLVARIR